MRKIIIATLLLLLSSTSYSTEWQLLNPTESYIDVYRYKSLYDPYLDPVDQELKMGGNFNLSFDLVKYNDTRLYWHNDLHFDQSEQSGKVRHGGWQYEIGLSLFKLEQTGGGIEIFQQHHSRHIFEDTRDTHFPVYDRYGVRFKIYDLR
jgi:hypothetical protein